MRCEVLLQPDTAKRGLAILEAMIAAAPAAGVEVVVSNEYSGAATWLMSYGLGHPVRRVWTRRHVKNGGRLIGWDLGYWHRESAMRLTVDQDHPQALLRDMPSSRWSAAGIELREDHDPKGPVVLVGLGIKQRQLKGFVGLAWETGVLRQIRAAYPDKRVIYRPKRPEYLAGCARSDGPIETVLAGASLVVCAHSNVAIDACIAGIPVVCGDGAAAALYRNNLKNPVKPDIAERRRFLHNLAWWQWKPEEAESAWKFLISSL